MPKSYSSPFGINRNMQGDPETRHLGFPGAITESGRAGAGMVGTPSCGPEPVPSGAVPEVARVLEAGSWYEVLEVSVSATAEEIKRAHKLKSLGTHPDKVGAARNSGAHEASVRVNMVRASAGPNASGSTAQLPGCNSARPPEPATAATWLVATQPCQGLHRDGACHTGLQQLLTAPWASG